MEFNYNNIIGFDVSKWQRLVQLNPPLVLEIDFAKMKAWGTRFVIIKAGQHNYQDPGFSYNWIAAKENGIPRGSYWFLDYRSSPIEQARKYWSLIKHDVGEGIHSCDFESGSDHKLDSLYQFMNEFQQISGLPNNKIAVYTGTYYFKEAIANSLAQRAWFSKFPLWLAWYADNPEIVEIPFPWSKVTLWQDGTPPWGYEVGAWSRDIDRNKFNGTEDEFKTYFGESTPPENGEEDMTSYYEVRSTNTSQTRTIRGGPRITYPSVGSMPTGVSTMAKGRVDDLYTYTTDSYDGLTLKARAGDQWVHIFELNGNPVDGWVAVRHLGVFYTTLKLISPPLSEYIVYVKDGVERRFIPE